MRKISKGALAALVILGSSTAALAIEATARVTFIDEEAGAILLNNADLVAVPAGFDLSTLAVGMLVTATYDDTGNEPFTATALEIVPPPETPAAPAGNAAPPAGAAPAGNAAPPAGDAPAAPAGNAAPPAGAPAGNAPPPAGAPAAPAP